MPMFESSSKLVWGSKPRTLSSWWKTNVPPRCGSSCPAPRHRGVRGSSGRKSAIPRADAARKRRATRPAQASLLRVERIAQPFAEKIEAEHRHHDQHPWEQEEPRVVPEVLLPVA